MKSEPTANLNASLAKANRLLLAFSESAPELGVMDLARRVGLNKSTVSRFVATLHQLGLLERVDDGKKYRLALRVFELGMLAVRHRPVFSNAERLLEQLAEKSGETAAIAVLADRDVVFLGKADAAFGTPLVLGRRYPAICCAAGKVLLSDLDAAADDGPAAARSSAEPGEPAPWRKELAEVRERGLASEHDELFAGCSSIAAPVLDRRNRVVAALSVCGPSTRLGPPDLERIGPILQRSAADLSRRLSRGPGAIRLAG